MPILEFEPLDELRPMLEYRHRIWQKLRVRSTKIRILFVCEGLAFSSPGGFSFEILLDNLRDPLGVKYAKFEITLASWGSSASAPVSKTSNPGDYQATYENYRFTATDPDDGKPILNKFDQVWLFGISPNGNMPLPEAAILQSTLAPSDAELQVLHKWMNAGGGVLAMGDHASLGACLVARIPRVWTMRRWSQEDGAPPRTGPERIDTNQIMWDAQNPEKNSIPETIPFDAQSDDVAQRVRVKRYPSVNWWRGGWRPHPLLCDGKLGVLDHLPDHPHEGWCVDVTGSALQANVRFAPARGVDAREYPDAAGAPLAPEVIAWGLSSSHPPLNLGKGPTTARLFGAIGAYDGHRAGVGRVVVDATWHHWMSINLSGSYATQTEEDGSELVGLKEANNQAYKEIVQYHRNTAIWLAPPKKQRQMCLYTVWHSLLSRHAFESFTADTPAWRLGVQGLDVLGRATSRCFVHRWLFELLPSALVERLELKPDPWGPLGVCCPAKEELETVALGLLMQRMIRTRDRLRQSARLETFTRKQLQRRLEADLAATGKVLVKGLAERARTNFKMFDARLERGLSEIDE